VIQIAVIVEIGGGSFSGFARVMAALNVRWLSRGALYRVAEGKVLELSMIMGPQKILRLVRPSFAKR
jgi:hypothetical protein